MTFEPEDPIVIFTKRSRKYLNTARWAFGAIVVMLGVALFTFVNAHKLTNDDLSKLSQHQSEIKKEIVALQSNPMRMPHSIDSYLEGVNNDTRTRHLVSAIKLDSQEYDRRLAIILEKMGEAVPTDQIKIYSLSSLIGVEIKNARLLTDYLKDRPIEDTISIIDSVLFLKLADEEIDGESFTALVVRRARNVSELEVITQPIFAKYDNDVERFHSNMLSRNNQIRVLENQTLEVHELKFDQQRALVEQYTKGTLPTSYLIQTNIYRFGPLLIILLFVTLLMRLYRFYIRLAIFYQTKADVFSFAEASDPETLLKYNAILSADHHDIGRVPRLSVEQLSEITKSLLGNKTL